MQTEYEQYDVDAIGDAFMEALDNGLALEDWFRDRRGHRWKYIARLEDTEVYIASHGDLGVVMTVDALADGRKLVKTELKRKADRT